MRRLTDRLLSLGPGRVTRVGADGVTPAARVRDVLQALADDGAHADGRDVRAVPLLADRALADQLTVLVADAVESGVPPAAVHARLVALRRVL